MIHLKQKHQKAESRVMPFQIPVLRIVTTAIAIGVLVLILFFFWTSDGPKSKIQVDSKKKEKPMVLKDPELSDFEDNRLTMRIRARKARIYEDEELTLLDEINGKVYEAGEQSEPTIILARSGRIEGNAKLMSVWGNVRVFFPDGEQLFTERLNMDQTNRRLYNDVEVRMTSGEDLIRADRMDYQIKTGVLVLQRPRAWVDVHENQ